MLKKLLLFTLAGAAIFTTGILIGHFGIDQKNSTPFPEWVQEIRQDVDENLIENFLAQVDTGQLQENLQVLTRVPHMATTAGDEGTVDFMLKRWQDRDSGLDAAWREDYRVYLSFPDKDKPNNVTVVRGSEVVDYIREKEKVYEPDQSHPDVVQPYAAFGPAGHVQGKLVYANQGKVSDYEQLNRTLGDLNGTIAIVRYGGAGRADKGINAAPFGVVGVLVYTDPYDINDGKLSDVNETYPYSWYLPPSGVERGSYKNNFGDQLTPYLAAKNDTYRIDEKDITGLSPIPIQPIGFEDAMKFICELDGLEAPESWQGSFPCKYNYGGPGFKNTSRLKDCDVKLDVYNKAGLRDSANVMGVIWGSVEPGKWRPRRTLIFGSWGAEEFGLIGSTEYAEEYISKLSQRTVAYINVDISVFGNALLHKSSRASASPVAQDVIFTAAKQVKIPGSDTMSVYSNWMRHSNRTSPTHGVIPSVGYLTGAGSDYAAFMHYLGISSMDISYTYDRSKTRARIYPAYHTAYDTFSYVSKFIDPGFTSHQAVARTAGNVLLRLADSVLLPFKCGDYAETLEQYLGVALENFEADLKDNSVSMEPLKEAVKSFRAACTSLEQSISSSDFINNSPLKARKINDQLMLLDRAFLNPLAFPEKYGYRHVVWTSRSSGVPTFPGLADAASRAKTSGLKQDWAEAYKHLSIITQAISGAAHTLAEAHAGL
ncbi:N-acetylated-alpha-linked acidic dipeptidase-like protein [Bagarius yarrelli]|uniref:Aminopeptidase NAALADL1 n=1 Tax=Bagarius yarrelli TaxID=175774 RepID=A0A556V0Y6_BAGYA|nr:N-acetylated-alpha-linked acidic dipeptidase-like protein [Bagarius yarrelli]